MSLRRCIISLTLFQEEDGGGIAVLSSKQNSHSLRLFCSWLGSPELVEGKRGSLLTVIIPSLEAQMVEPGCDF